MKKLFGFIMIMFVTAGVYGQYDANGDNYSHYEQPVIVGLKHNELYESSKLRTVELNINVYHFWENDTLYVLSYDTTKVSIYIPKNRIIERNIYLFRCDKDGWKVASGVVKTDYKNCDTGEWESMTNNFRVNIERKSDLNVLLGNDVGYSEVTKLDDGIYKMKVLFFSGIERQDPAKYRNIGWRHRMITYVFISNGNGTFNVIQK